MFIGTDIIAICADGIPKNEKQNVLSTIKDSSKDVIFLTYEQVNSFCGNALEVLSEDGKKFLALSQSSFSSFTKCQIEKLNHYYDELVYSDLRTIEKYGGGSSRCLLLEMF